MVWCCKMPLWNFPESKWAKRGQPITEIPWLIVPVERPGLFLISRINFFINSSKTETFCLLLQWGFYTQLGVLKLLSIKTLLFIIVSQFISSNAVLVWCIPPSHIQSFPTQFSYISKTRVFLQCLFDCGSRLQISMKIKYNRWIRSVI